MYFTLFIFISVFAWMSLRYIQFKYVNTLSGDNITHLLFHNLMKDNQEHNPAGVVGVGRLNLPIVLYRISSFFFPKFYVNKSIILPSINVILILMIELTLFCLLYCKSGDILFAATASLAFSFFPAFGLATTTESGSYVKYSERMPALFANSLLAGLLMGAVEFGWYIDFVLVVTTFYFSCVLGKFSRQVLVLIITSFLVINLRLDYILVMGFVLLIMMSQREFRGEVLAQITYLATYKQFQSQNFEVSKERLLDFGIPGIFVENIYFRIYSRLMLHSGFNILLCLPTIMHIFIYGTPEANSFMVVVLSFSLLTTTHVFYFVGPGYRYLYNVLPVLLMTELEIGQNIHYLLYANMLMSIISTARNYKAIYSKIDSVNTKVLAYRNMRKRVASGKTIFFDHYKDAEIFQLISENPLECKLSTSRDYAWTIECKKLFSKYPLVDLTEPALKLFNVTYIISKNPDLKIEGFENVYRDSGYNLYGLKSSAVNQ